MKHYTAWRPCNPPFQRCYKALPAEPSKTLENQKPKFKIIFSLLGLAVILFLAFWFVIKKPGASAEALDEFAQCLAQKGVTMYGTYWCPHCQAEKKAFGDSFRFVSYVECSTESKKCLDAGVGGYPTWIFADGRKFEGEQGIEKLSQESGCPLQ